MKKRLTCTLLVVVLAFSLFAVAFAASATMNAYPDGYSTAFFSQVVNNSVTVTQTTAAWQGTSGTVRWVLSDSNTGVAVDMDYVYGASSSSPLYAGTSGNTHMLRGFNQESTKLIVVYSYSIS